MKDKIKNEEIETLSTTTKYIILIRSINPNIKMKQFREDLNKIKGFQNVKIWCRTGNVILDLDDTISRKELNEKFIEFLESKKCNMKNPIIKNYTVDEYKTILSFNPFIEKKIKDKSIIFFPMGEKLLTELKFNGAQNDDDNGKDDNGEDNNDEDNEKNEFESKCKLIEGIIFYNGPTSGNPSTIKNFLKLNKITQTGSGYESTHRRYESAKKVLEMAS
ncbi:hypothetical protein ACTA71_000815 [Dictyostelium dimigraforme]